MSNRSSFAAECMFTHLPGRNSKSNSKSAKAPTDSTRNFSKSVGTSATETNQGGVPSVHCSVSGVTTNRLSTIKMTSGVVQKQRRKVYTFDLQAMEDPAIAPDDELRGMTKAKQNARRAKPHSEQKQEHRRHHTRNKQSSNSNSNRKHSRKGHDDEDRIPPPPMEIVTNSSSNHPDFEAWKRDMTQTLMSGTVRTSPTKLPNNKSVVETTDWKTARINKRRLEKKLLHQQLRSVKSDTSTTTESESSEDEHSTIETSRSSSFLQNGKDFSKTQKTPRRTRETRSKHDIHTVYIRNRPGTSRNARSHTPEAPPSTTPFFQLTSNISMPLSPKSAAFLRPTVSAVEQTLSPENLLPNASELAEIMGELSDLKAWAAGAIAAPSNFSTQLLRQSTPPSSPTSPLPPKARTAPLVASKPNTGPSPAETAKKQTTPSLPKSIVVPQLVSTPKTILVPHLTHSGAPDEPGTKYKSMIERQIGSKDKGVPTMLTIQKTKENETKQGIKNAMAITRKRNRRVHFSKTLVTDTFYRPWTLREDVDALYFQEEELEEWERDEVTTLRDRFEVVVTDFGNDKTYTGNHLSIGTPVISFHNSFSCSFYDSSDEEESLE